MKRILMLLILIMATFMIACKEEQPSIKDISTTHNVNHEIINSYLRVMSRPVKQDDSYYLAYSQTILANFNKTPEISKRYYNFYQVDWTTNTGITDHYYHIFDYLDGSIRNYSQNFAPYHRLDGDTLTQIRVKFEYEYDYTLYDEVSHKEETFAYLEDILTIEEEDLTNLTSNIDGYNFQVIKESANANTTRYNLIVNFNDSGKGHLDIQTWGVMGQDFVPLYGLYHYQLENGDYDDYKPGVEVDSSIIIDEVYLKIQIHRESTVDAYIIKIPVSE